ncbi:MAG: hypothetical protein RL154_676 [Pseudomonadota bacterium]|jgi:hypothetical protein
MQSIKTNKYPFLLLAWNAKEAYIQNAICTTSVNGTQVDNVLLKPPKRLIYALRYIPTSCFTLISLLLCGIGSQQAGGLIIGAIFFALYQYFFEAEYKYRFYALGVFGVSIILSLLISYSLANYLMFGIQYALILWLIMWIYTNLKNNEYKCFYQVQNYPGLFVFIPKKSNKHLKQGYILAAIFAFVGLCFGSFYVYHYYKAQREAKAASVVVQQQIATEKNTKQNTSKPTIQRQMSPQEIEALKKFGGSK